MDVLGGKTNDRGNGSGCPIKGLTGATGLLELPEAAADTAPSVKEGGKGKEEGRYEELPCWL